MVSLFKELTVYDLEVHKTHVRGVSTPLLDPHCCRLGSNKKQTLRWRLICRKFIGDGSGLGGGEVLLELTPEEKKRKQDWAKGGVDLRYDLCGSVNRH